MLDQTYMGNEAFYVKMLKKLPGKDYIPRLEAAVSAGNVAEVFSIAHDLKGIYGTLGLTPLFAKCCEILEPARKGSMEGVPENFPVLREMHEEFMTLIQNA